MPIIIVLKIVRLLERGCEGYLASMVTKTRKQRPKFVDTLVVNDFPEVFPEELPQLPPNREIEFTIELLPRITLFRGRLIG